MKTPIFILSLLAFTGLNAQSPAWDWGRGAGGAGFDEANAIATTPSGDSYVAGKFNATATFGAYNITSYGGPDIFLAKYNTFGVCLWLKHAGSTDTQDADGDEAKGVGVDAAGNCYVTGNFKGAASFGSLNLSTGTAREIFLVKYDSNGNELWARSPTGNGLTDNYARAISVDAAGNSWITGSLGAGSCSFGSYTLTGQGGFVAKYDANGNVVYASKIGLYGSINLYGIGTDNSGNAYVAGTLLNQEIIGSQTYTASGMYDVVLIKLDPAGNFVWLGQSWSPYSTSVTKPTAVCCDASGGVYMCGVFIADIAFGSDTLVRSNPWNNQDAFLAKYDSNGNPQWARQTVVVGSGAAIMEANAVTVSPNSMILMTGAFADNFMFGNVLLTTTGAGCNTYIAGFNTSGVCQYGIFSTGSNTIALGNGISTDNSGGVYIAGVDKSRVVFGTDTTVAYVPLDVFVAKADAGGKQIGISEAVSGAGAGFVYNSSNAYGVLNLQEDILPNEKMKFQLYDMTGRIIFEIPVSGNKQVIELNGMAAGIYSWSVIDSQKRIGAGKIVVE